MRRLAVPLLLALLFLGSSILVGCGHHRPTVWLSSTSASTTSASHSPSPSPGSPSPSAPAAPVSSAIPSAPPAPQLALEVLGPQPTPLEADAQEALVLAFELRASHDATLTRVRVDAEGSLEDTQDVRTARLALDVDGDARFDRAIDRVLGTAGFSGDDGELEFVLAERLSAGAPARLLVTLDLSGSARPQDDLRLRLEADAFTLASGAVVVLPATGAQHRVGRWTLPQLTIPTPGDALSPRALRDSRGRTHVSLSQNHNFNSDVWYSLFDGRSFSPVDDVSHSPATSWNQDIALDPQDAPTLVWEAWDTRFADYGVRFSRFDGQAFRWTDAEVLSDEAGLAPRVEYDGRGQVHVCWEGRNGGVYHRSLRNGAWSDTAEITSAAQSARPNQVALTRLASGEVLALWAENDFGRAEIRARQLSNGAGYGPLEVVASAGQTIERPDALSEGGTVHAVFEWGGEIHYAARTAAGWLPSQAITNTSGLSTEATLTLHGQPPRLQVVWVEDETGGGLTATQIAHAEALPGGGFSPPSLLTRGLGSRASPTVVSEDERLLVLWQDWSPGRQRLYGCWREPGGWGAPRTVVAPNAEPQRAALARTRGGELAAAYALDAGGNSEVWVALASDPSASSLRALNVSRSASASYAATLAPLGSESLVAAWEEDGPSGFQVHASLGGAAGFSTPAAISSAGPAYSPSAVALEADAALVAWSAPVAGRHAIQIRGVRAGTWGSIATLASDALAELRSPDLAAIPGGFVCVFERDASNQRREVWCATQDARGLTIAPVASGTRGQYAPRVASEGGRVVVAWVEDGQVCSSERAPGSSVFGPVRTLNAGGAWSVDVALVAGQVSVAWEQWSGSEVRPVVSHETPAGFSAPRFMDRTRAQGRRVSLLGTPTGGLDLSWSEPTGLVLRQRGADQ